MRDELLTRLFNHMTVGFGIDDTVAGHLVNDIEEIIEEPDLLPASNLTLCKVCRAPVPEPKPKAEAAKDCHISPTTAIDRQPLPPEDNA